MSNQIININDTISEKSTENINKNMNIINIDNTKGRKKDDIRRYFISQNNRLKCIINECNKTFSTKTSVTSLRCHIINEHGNKLDIKLKNTNINSNMEN